MQNSEIKTEVESWLLDLPSGASTRVQGWVNEAVKAACKRKNFRFMEAEHSVTTTDQTRKLDDKPSDWKEARGEPYLVNQDGSTTVIQWAPSESDMVRTFGYQAPAEGNDAEIDEGEPRYILETTSELHVYPFPDDESLWDNGLYRVRAPYWKFLAALSADGDTNEFTDNAEYYLIYFAAAKGFAWNRDEERAANFFQLAEREYQQFLRWYKRSQLPDRLNLAFRRDVYAGKPRSGNKG